MAPGGHGQFRYLQRGGEKSLREFARKLQRFDSTLRMLFKTPENREVTRLTIYLVPSANDAGRLATGKSGSSIWGFYRTDDEGSFAVSPLQRNVIMGTSKGQQVLFHEYSHHFMKRHIVGAFPSWLIEGFAEYYSTMDFTASGQPEVGKIPFRRAYGLIMMPKIPVETLLFQKAGAQRGAAKGEVYYGRAWLLTHMLQFETARAGQLDAYVRAINEGIDERKAALDAFGDLAELERDLNRYLQQRLSYSTIS